MRQITYGSIHEALCSVFTDLEEHHLGIEVNQPELIEAGTCAVNRVAVFVDEIKPSQVSNWAYVCILTVPCVQLKRALLELEEDRKTERYDHELHFSDIKNVGDKSRLAKRWLSRVMDDHRTWHFSVLGLNTTNLCKEWFGERPCEQIYGPYKRFFRATLHHHLASAHTRSGLVKVWRVFHDSEGMLESDPWFPWHAQSLIESANPNIVFEHPQIEFIASDHRKETKRDKCSHFVQVCDLIVGTVRHCHEAPTSHRGKNDVAKHFLPLVERLNCKSRFRNVNSRYKHSSRAFLSYFPDRAMTMEDLLDPDVVRRGEFYRGRRLALNAAMGKQEVMDFNL